MAFKRINKENLLYNVNYFKKILPLNTLFCAVVKSNAYGHGVKEVIEEINNYVDYYAVTSIKEGVELRNYTKKNILVLRGFGDDENLFQARFEKHSKCHSVNKLCYPIAHHLWQYNEIL